MRSAVSRLASRAYGAINLANKSLAALLVLSTTAIADEITIAALGDSLTQGYGLPPEDGFVPQLEAWLAGQGAAVTVQNAGVSGDTTAGGLARIDWTLGEDVDALIVTLGGNDLLRGLQPENSRENLRGILEAAASREIPVLLSGMSAPGNYGPDYKEAFDAMYPDLAAAHGAILYPSFFAGLEIDADLEAARKLMQPDGIHPNRDGVARIVADIGPYVLELIDAAVE